MDGAPPPRAKRGGQGPCRDPGSAGEASHTSLCAWSPSAVPAASAAISPSSASRNGTVRDSGGSSTVGGEATLAAAGLRVKPPSLTTGAMGESTVGRVGRVEPDGSEEAAGASDGAFGEAPRLDSSVRSKGLRASSFSPRSV